MSCVASIGRCRLTRARLRSPVDALLSLSLSSSLPVSPVSVSLSLSISLSLSFSLSLSLSLSQSVLQQKKAKNAHTSSNDQAETYLYNTQHALFACTLEKTIKILDDDNVYGVLHLSLTCRQNRRPPVGKHLKYTEFRNTLQKAMNR